MFQRLISSVPPTAIWQSLSGGPLNWSAYLGLCCEEASLEFPRRLALIEAGCSCHLQLRQLFVADTDEFRIDQALATNCNQCKSFAGQPLGD